jgi:hypothetical protein
MADAFMARCGIDCEACKYREQMNCPGCPATGGKPFWGECQVARCCIGKGHEHCGQCAEFPCELLKKFAYDPEQGDNGRRIRNLEAWNEKGYDVWRKEKSI